MVIFMVFMMGQPSGDDDDFMVKKPHGMITSGDGWTNEWDEWMTVASMNIQVML